MYFKSLTHNLKQAWAAKDPRSVVCEKYRFVYYPVPKAACSSMLKMIADINGDDIDMNSLRGDFQYLRGDQKKNYPDYVHFTVVRNPYARVLSCYANKICGRDTIAYSFQRYNQVFRLRLFWHQMPFEDFVERICKIPDFLADEHFRSQNTLLSTATGNFVPQKFIQLENSEAELIPFLENLGLDSETLGHHNRSGNSQTNFQEVYTDKSREIVRRRYIKDLKRFGYSFH